MEMLSPFASQEDAVRKKRPFSTPHLVPVSNSGGQSETLGKLLPCFIHVALHPAFYNVTWQALHDEGLMIYFLSWNVGIAEQCRVSAN